MSRKINREDLSLNDRLFYDRTNECLKRVSFQDPGEKQYIKKQLKLAQNSLCDPSSPSDRCYNFCFVNALMNIIEFLTALKK